MLGFFPAAPTGWPEGRAAQAGRQQNRVCPAGVCAGPWTELRAREGTDAGGKAAQSLHVQLCEEVHEYCGAPGRSKTGLSAVHQGSVRDCTEKVRTFYALG